MLRTLYSFLYFLFRPSWWHQNYPYSKAWSDRLNELMDEHEFESIGSSTAKLGGVEIWVANHPYASFYVYHGIRVLPDRSTRKRAMEKLIRDTVCKP